MILKNLKNIKCKINTTALNLKESDFVDYNKNIEYLTNTEIENLISVNEAIKLVNRFHSYFHFEQSYAYNLLADCYFLLQDKQKAIEIYEKAIFQDHLNTIAIKSLIFASDTENSKQKYIAQLSKLNENYEINFNSDLLLIRTNKGYAPQFRYEREYIKFATLNSEVLVQNKEVDLLDKAIKLVEIKTFTEAKKILDILKINSHRKNIADALIALNIEDVEIAIKYLKEAVINLEARHKSYHQEASLIYLKRASIFKNLGEIELFKNDLVKANDLDVETYNKFVLERIE
ncbi:MAG: hypothetical protein J0H68_08705 [Sphingobacteriia bacterium]|nr:hypothetical protein [Sphingobacteriia bacterium]